MREMALIYDVYGYPFNRYNTKEEFVERAINVLTEDGKIAKGDLVGFIGGNPDTDSGATYMEFRYV